MTDILDKMLSADVIVLDTAVYSYSVSAQMKMMIDRTVPAYERMTNKEAISFSRRRTRIRP